MQAGVCLAFNIIRAEGSRGDNNFLFKGVVCVVGFSKVVVVYIDSLFTVM